MSVSKNNIVNILNIYFTPDSFLSIIHFGEVDNVNRRIFIRNLRFGVLHKAKTGYAWRLCLWHEEPCSAATIITQRDIPIAKTLQADSGLTLTVPPAIA